LARNIVELGPRLIALRRSPRSKTISIAAGVAPGWEFQLIHHRVPQLEVIRRGERRQLAHPMS
jgi:hypothetical protein